jgi:hypothetical protein
VHNGAIDSVIQRLHQTAGNRAAGDWIQAKLKVGTVDDPSERQADRVADHFTRASSPGLQRDVSSASLASSSPSATAREDAPPIVNHVLESPGSPLDQGTRAFFESGFGQSFDNVRIHTDHEAAKSARSIEAVAYTAGDHVVFDQGRYVPQSDAGRHLIAHELTHVIQQGQEIGGKPYAPPKSSSLVQREPQDQTTPPAATIPNTSRDRSRWVSKVDSAVRDLFKLSGPGLSDSKVSFLDQQHFGALFTGQGLEDKLYSLFVDYGYNPHILPNGTPFGEILDYNHVTYGTVGYSDPETSLSGGTVQKELRDFVRAGITKGFFTGLSHSEFDLATHSFPKPYKITPQELITRYIAGITDIAGPRSKRHVNIQGFKDPTIGELKPEVSTLVHETCHFYVSENFRDMAEGRKDGQSLIGGERISEVLTEGFAEYFAREVMQKNERTFGPRSDAYPLATRNAELLVALIGESRARTAYFGGDKRAITSLSMLVDEWKSAGGEFPPVDVITGADPRAETPKSRRGH